VRKRVTTSSLVGEAILGSRYLRYLEYSLKSYSRRT